MGPGTPGSFGEWAGIKPPRASSAFEALGGSLAPVRTPIGDAWILATDEALFRAAAGPPAPGRLLPSGDAYWLLRGRDREILVPEADRRAELWTPRLWPGALLVEGEIVGTWRRAGADLTIRLWRRLTSAERDAVEADAASLPLPDLGKRIRVRLGTSGT